MSQLYRSCVIAVIVDEEGRILVGERSDKPGVWQMPQGGVEKAESAEQALFRELREEIGTSEVDVVEQLEDAISYDFPAEILDNSKNKYIGQSQVWFMVKLKQHATLDLTKSDGEFLDLKWQEPAAVIAGIVSWKKEAYYEGLTKFNLIRD